MNARRQVGHAHSSIRGPIVLGVPRVLDVERPVPGEQLAVPGVARRQHAVEQVDAPGDAIRPGRRACPVPIRYRGRSSGQLRGRVADDVVHESRRARRPTGRRSRRPRSRRRPSRRRSRRAGPLNVPPWTMPNCAWPGVDRRDAGDRAGRERAGSDRGRGAPSGACAPSPPAPRLRVAGQLGHSSNIIATSEPRRA